MYDVASVTKSIPLASLAAELVAEKKLSLETRVKSFIPELRNDFGATIEDLLRYRVRGVPLSSLKHKTFEEIKAAIYDRGLDGPPGESIYTNLPAYLLGVVIARAGGESLAVLARHAFFDPLGMRDTTFFPREAARCAPTEIDFRGEVRALPHDESAHVFARAGRTVGHAGLFSTAPDLLSFLEALIAGTYAHVTDFAQRGLGWSVAERYFMGQSFGSNTFGKTGFTGTSVMCDVERGIALVILSNWTYPQRPVDAASSESRMNSFRRDIADMVFGSA